MGTQASSETPDAPVKPSLTGARSQAPVLSTKAPVGYSTISIAHPCSTRGPQRARKALSSAKRAVRMTTVRASPLSKTDGSVTSKELEIAAPSGGPPRHMTMEDFEVAYGDLIDVPNTATADMAVAAAAAAAPAVEPEGLAVSAQRTMTPPTTPTEGQATTPAVDPAYCSPPHTGKCVSRATAKKRAAPVVETGQKRIEPIPTAATVEHAEMKKKHVTGSPLPPARKPYVAAVPPLPLNSDPPPWPVAFRGSRPLASVDRSATTVGTPEMVSRSPYAEAASTRAPTASLDPTEDVCVSQQEVHFLGSQYNITGTSTEGSYQQSNHTADRTLLSAGADVFGPGTSRDSMGIASLPDVLSVTQSPDGARRGPRHAENLYSVPINDGASTVRGASSDGTSAGSNRYSVVAELPQSRRDRRAAPPPPSGTTQKRLSVEDPTTVTGQGWSRPVFRSGDGARRVSAPITSDAMHEKAAAAALTSQHGKPVTAPQPMMNQRLFPDHPVSPMRRPSGTPPEPQPDIYDTRPKRKGADPMTIPEIESTFGYSLRMARWVTSPSPGQ